MFYDYINLETARHITLYDAQYLNVNLTLTIRDLRLYNPYAEI